MNEDLITFETAKLAKEKGFDWDCDKYLGEGEYKGRVGCSVDCKIYYPAPTQSHLQKWLREKNIYVEPFSFMAEISTFEKFKKYGVYVCGEHTCTMDTWEEVLEDGLKDGLNLIKKES